jgi:hypothetical protein
LWIKCPIEFLAKFDQTVLFNIEPVEVKTFLGNAFTQQAVDRREEQLHDRGNILIVVATILKIEIYCWAKFNHRMHSYPPPLKKEIFNINYL